MTKQLSKAQHRIYCDIVRSVLSIKKKKKKFSENKTLTSVSGKDKLITY